ncbi:hypothetical protein PSTG_06694 [Puccinia striiformis f. sp. tritici PST-78]|uniref:5-formyltetrahydrofolate cyclo-ligase n=1 Tax=Puccinia striiformis f. sp. tritici PST-78 TaxID=1165861 RepID=A0A0L0VLI8_9BASI|nr:hypothetical protein PSTG_06694 [Puccinia striiformis f. sp. tritici PST-78]
MEMLKLENWAEFQTGLVPVTFSLSSNSPKVLQFDPTKISGRENGLTEGLDLILLPGLAFDRFGNRLGHGKGYYDEYLEEYDCSPSSPNLDQTTSTETPENGRKSPVLVGICLREQLLPEKEFIPVHAHDRKLDYIISPDEVLHIPKRKGFRKLVAVFPTRSGEMFSPSPFQPYCSAKCCRRKQAAFMRCSQSLGASFQRFRVGLILYASVRWKVNRAQAPRLYIHSAPQPAAGVWRRGLDPRGPLYKPSSKAKAQCFHTYRYTVLLAFEEHVSRG